MSESEWKKRVYIKSNGDFISIKTYSGYSLPLADPTVPEKLLSPTITNEMLGTAILDALQKSRFLPIEQARILRMNTEQNYKDWIQKLLTQYGYKTKNALFKKMLNCDLILDNSLIIIEPTLHEKLEAWSGDGIKPEDYVKIPADSSPAEIGAALRLAFKRCRGAKPDEYK